MPGPMARSGSASAVSPRRRKSIGRWNGSRRRSLACAVRTPAILDADPHAGLPAPPTTAPHSRPPHRDVPDTVGRHDPGTAPPGLYVAQFLLKICAGLALAPGSYRYKNGRNLEG